MSDEPTLIQQYGERFIAAVIGAWWFLMRVLFGWHFKTLEKLDTKLDKINTRLSRLEGKSTKRDYNDLD